MKVSIIEIVICLWTSDLSFLLYHGLVTSTKRPSKKTESLQRVKIYYYLVKIWTKGVRWRLVHFDDDTDICSPLSFLFVLPFFSGRIGSVPNQCINVYLIRSVTDSLDLKLNSNKVDYFIWKSSFLIIRRRMIIRVVFSCWIYTRSWLLFFCLKLSASESRNTENRLTTTKKRNFIHYLELFRLSLYLYKLIVPFWFFYCFVLMFWRSTLMILSLVGLTEYFDYNTKENLFVSLLEASEF